MTGLSSDAQRFVFAVRNVVGRSETKTQFVNDTVMKAKELRRTAQTEYEAHLGTLFKALDLYQLTGGNASEMACALTTLSILLQLPLTAAHLSQCNSSIRVCLLSSTDASTIQAASRIVGESIAISGPNDFIRKAIDDAMIWIGLTEARSEVRRIGGLAVLDEVLQRVPVLFLKYLPEFFDRIWTPLSDSIQEVRDAATNVLQHAVKLLNSRDKASRSQMFAAIYSRLRTLFQSKNVDQSIAALSVLDCIVRASMEHRDGPKYDDMVSMLQPVLGLATTSTSQRIRLFLFQVYAVLCLYNPEAFTAKDLKNAVNYGLEYTKKDFERPFAFRMLRDIIRLVKAKAFDPYLDQTIVAIKQVIIMQKRQGRPPVWESLECLAVICKECPSVSVEAHVKSCIEHVFGYGLSTQLIDCMRDIVAASSEAARLKLEESMLDLISITLCGLPFRQHARSGSEKTNSVFSNPSEPTEEQIVIALDALLKFGFSNSEQLGDFLRDSVLPFVDSEQQAIRIAAIRTIVALLLPASASPDLTFSRRMCVDLVVSRLLVIGTADTDAVIRRLVFSSFNAPYFPYLCESQFLFQVCIALGDEESQCRVTAIQLVCRMLPHNPSHILPVLRKEMVKILQTMAKTDRVQLIEPMLHQLSSISVNAPMFARTFHANVMELLVPMFHAATLRTPYLGPLVDCMKNASAANMFSTISNTKSRHLVLGVISKSLEFMETLPMDKTFQSVRCDCMSVLTSLLRPSFDGASPYQSFPNLFQLLSSIVRNKDEAMSMRLEALRAFGKIGALDPHQFAELDISDGTTTFRSETIRTLGRLDEKVCTRVVLDAVASVLSPRNARVVAGGSESLLRSALKTTLMICERSQKSVIYEDLRVLFPPLCDLLLEIPQNRLFYTALHELGNLITLCGRKSLQHIGHFQALARGLWCNPKSRFLVIRMLSLLADLAEKDTAATNENLLGIHLAELMPIMLDSLATGENPSSFKSILEFILHHDVYLQPFTHRICGTLFDSLHDRKLPIDFCSHIVVVLSRLALLSPLREVVPPMIRCCLAKLTHYVTTTVPTPTEANPFVAKTLALLCVLASEKEADFGPFAPDVLRCLKTLRLTNQQLTFLCMQSCRGTFTPTTLGTRAKQELASYVEELLEHVFVQSYASSLAEVGEIWGEVAKQIGEFGKNRGTARTESVDDSEVHQSPTDSALLPIAESRIVDTVCKASTLAAKDDWLRWYDELCKVLVCEAPYHVFRCVTTSPGVNSLSLVDRCPDIVQDILNIAFRAVYVNATFNLRAVIAECVTKVVSSPTSPDDVIASVLSIAEYMDMCGYALQIPAPRLAEVARIKGMLAKALYWQEQSYRLNPKECTQDLIAIYSSLGHMDSAVGLLNQKPAAMISVKPNLTTSSEVASVDGEFEERDASGPTVAQQQCNLIKLGKFGEALDLMTRHNTSFSFPNQSSVFDDSMFRSSLIASPPAARTRHTRTRSLSTMSDTDGSFSHIQDHEMARRLEAESRKILCLSELGDMHGVLAEWRLLSIKLANQKPGEDDDSLLAYIAPFAADAAVRLKSWDDLSDAVAWVPKDTIAYGSSLAALQIGCKQLDAAQNSVHLARQLLLDDITGLLHESYARAYDGIVVAQQLVELEEIIATLHIDDGMLRQAQGKQLSSTWSERISNSAQSVAAWKRILSSRGLLIPPEEDISTRILFVKLCREYGASRKLERFTLEQMLGCRSPTYDQLTDPTCNPRVVFEYITHLSACGELSKYASHGDERSIITRLIEIHGGRPENMSLEARMHARRGYGAEVRNAIECYQTATVCDPTWFHGWRFWAEANMKFLENSPKSERHVVDAIAGFVKSIELAHTTSNKLQDVLKVLSLWSRYGDTPKGLAELEKRVFDISLSVWQLVIPQLIARLDSGSDESCALVAKVIAAVAMQHPQSLIYPLNVCTTSNVARRQMWASDILSKMEHSFPRLVAQGKLVTTELIRIASLIYEQWHEALESAATAFFGRRDHVEMMEILLPVHEAMKKSPETLVEVEFHAKYHRLLEEARHWIRSFSLTGKFADIHSAWNIYHAIYKQIDEQLKSGSTLSMQYCSPRLWEARNLALAIPDARPKEGKDTIRIAAFDDKLTVIASKQRPKRIAFQGTDGKAHKFLLKGHEDLRLDERVMQLFKLVNTLLLANAHTSKIAGYQLQRYSVTPLWDTVGLIGWVDECDTIHELIHAYRQERDIVPELELKLMQHIITVDQPKAFDYLSIMSKVEVLEFLWDHTSGHDIRKAMWASSLTCETWLERRNTFTTSLATMSVVGYILGLGDRHPNNIMIQRSTGKVVHIDFGDCFEVAMTRDRFPEKVPFRLTRMLQNAMEVSGVDGNFRSSAETVMTALRENKDSLIAMLAAFVQDPLISWRLVKRTGEDLLNSADQNKPIEEAREVAVREMNSEDDDAAPLMMMVPFSDDDDMSALEMTRRQKADNAEEDRKANEEEVAHQGVAILNRLASKLRGQEFISRRRGSGSLKKSFDAKSQVSKLIAEATDISNIAQSWSGWYPFW